MTTFALTLQSPMLSQRIDGVTSLVARDRSGSFGVLAGHARMITLVEAGLLRFRCGGDTWEYAACAGGVLYVRGAEAVVCTSRFVTGTDYSRLTDTLEAQLRAERESLKSQRSHVARIEEEMMRRLWRLHHD
jgi:F-type H+-transporting ATPase subunit epsilon